MNWIKKIAINLTVIFVAILFAFIIFLLIDFSVHFVKTFNLKACGEPKLKGFYELKKQCYGKSKFYNSVYNVKTDQFGFRVNENKEEQKERKNFIFLGDSFTFGINGSWDETFVGMFEKKTSQPVVNAGLGSYSPTVYSYQYQKALKSKILSENHTVIIAIDISDVQDEAGYWTDGYNSPIKMEYAQNFVPSDQKGFLKIKKIIGLNLPYTKIIYKYVRRIILESKNSNSEYKVENIPRSAFTHTIWNNLEKEYAAPNDKGYLPLGVKGGLEKLELKTTEIVKKAKLSGSKTYFLIYPWPAQLIYEQNIFSWNNFIKNLCLKSSCDGVIDTFPAFKRSLDDDKKLDDIFWIGDVHFTKYGNKIIADELYKYFNN